MLSSLMDQSVSASFKTPGVDSGAYASSQYSSYLRRDPLDSYNAFPSSSASGSAYSQAFTTLHDSRALSDYRTDPFSSAAAAAQAG